MHECSYDESLPNIHYDNPSSLSTQKGANTGAYEEDYRRQRTAIIIYFAIMFSEGRANGISACAVQLREKKKSYSICAFREQIQKMDFTPSRLELIYLGATRCSFRRGQK